MRGRGIIAGLAMMALWMSPLIAQTSGAANSESVAKESVTKEPSTKGPATKEAAAKDKEKEKEKPARRKTRIFESSSYEPELIYRMIGLTARRNSLYYKESEKENYADQVYLSLKFERTYNYRNQVVIVPALRSKLKASTVEPIIEQGFLRSDLLPNLTLTAGKKMEISGSGFLVNPSDLLNENRDIFDPLNQREGRTFTRLMWQGSWAGIGLGYIPETGNSVEKGRLWGLLNADIWRFDIRMQWTGSEADKSTTGLSIVRFLGDSFELHLDSRYQTRQRSESVQVERPFSSYTREDASFFAVLGDRIIFTPKRSLVTEYIYNQSGLLPDELKAFYQAEETKDEEQRDVQKRLLGRRYAYLAYMDEDSFRNASLGFSTAFNTEDGSAFGSLLWRYKWSPITSLEFQPTFFSGKKYAEFGEAPYKYLYYLTFKGRF